MEKNLVIVPKGARNKVMRLAYISMVAGHFAKDRTLQMITSRMDWPGVAKDVRAMCESCLVCQKFYHSVVARALLQPLAMVRNPFDRIAMDIFGPLMGTASGNHYILTAMDYTQSGQKPLPLRMLQQRL